MKSTSKVVPQKPVFEPIELTITIESQDELLELYHRINVGASRFDGIHSVHPKPSSFSNTEGLWSLLEKHVRKLNG